MNPHKFLLLQINEYCIIATYSTYMKDFKRAHLHREIQAYYNSFLLPWITSHSESTEKQKWYMKINSYLCSWNGI